MCASGESGMAVSLCKSWQEWVVLRTHSYPQSSVSHQQDHIEDSDCYLVPSKQNIIDGKQNKAAQAMSVL